MTDNRVRYERYENDTEIGSEPTVSRAAGDQRHDKIHSYTACRRNDDSGAEVLKLRTCQPTSRSPLLYEDSQSRYPGDDEVSGKDWMQRPRFPCQTLRRQDVVVSDERCRERQEGQFLTCYKRTREEPYLCPRTGCEIATF